MLALEKEGKNPYEVLSCLFDQCQSLSEKNSTSRVFKFKHISGVSVRPLAWLIHDFFELDSLVELFGEPESCKSLLAIDWALSIASGKSWKGHAVSQGAVFYIAGEGHNGLARRFHAWSKANNTPLENIPFYSSVGAGAFCSGESARQVKRAVSDISKKTGEKPVLIVIDTLARNFGGGNENSTEDMTQFISNIDQLRAEFNATVLLVHHTGHGASERGRGSSALKAAVDTEFSMKKAGDGVVTLSCSKMKDATYPDPMSFQVLPVDIGLANEDKVPISGVTLEQTEYRKPSKPEKSGMGKNQSALLDALEKLTNEHREEYERRGKNPDDAKVTLKHWQEVAGLENNRFAEAKNKLKDRGLVWVDSSGFVYLSET